MIFGGPGDRRNGALHGLLGLVLGVGQERQDGITGLDIQPLGVLTKRLSARLGHPFSSNQANNTKKIPLVHIH
ncbi:hypothetical protein ORS3428_12375 [Mesorhizobium sp. ORS 3428]|nr:hypothetical protein ORS3428_12375 [Mesorhizobium sp. ORS 3428]